MRRRAVRIWFNQTSGSTFFCFDALRANVDRHRVHILCTHRDARSPLFQRADSWAVEPDGVTPADYVSWALDYCRANAVEVFVPRRELRAIAENASRFAALGVRLLLPTIERLEDLDDKARTYELAASLEVAIPRYELANDHDSYRLAFDSLRSEGHSVCHKPIRDVGGAGFRRVSARPRDANDLFRRPGPDVGVDEVLNLLHGAGTVKTLMLSEYLPAPEFSVDCIAWQGTLLGAVVRIKFGGQVREIVERPDLLDIVRVLARELKLDYVFNAQFRDALNPRLLEVNPRPSAGLHQSVAVGYLWESVRLALDQEPRDVPWDEPRLVASLPAAIPMQALGNVTQLPAWARSASG
jgi:hypothetical protein